MSTRKHYPQRPRRFEISRRGTLSYGSHRFPCLVQEVSEQGLFLICNYDLEIGLELDVEFELERGADFSGRILVRHCYDGCVGAELIAADARSRRNWKHFLESHYSGQPVPEERRISA